jgi:hypothetical protein
VDKCLNGFDGRFGKGLGGWQLLEQSFRHAVDLLVRALGRHDGSHKQFKWIFVVQLRLDFRVERP